MPLFILLCDLFIALPTCRVMRQMHGRKQRGRGSSFLSMRSFIYKLRECGFTFSFCLVISHKPRCVLANVFCSCFYWRMYVGKCLYICDTCLICQLDSVVISRLLDRYQMLETDHLYCWNIRRLIIMQNVLNV